MFDDVEGMLESTKDEIFSSIYLPESILFRGDNAMRHLPRQLFRRHGGAGRVSVDGYDILSKKCPIKLDINVGA